LSLSRELVISGIKGFLSSQSEMEVMLVLLQTIAALNYRRGEKRGKVGAEAK
jgi:hypothetical protein